MKDKFSTILNIVAVVALAVCWYVDTQRDRRAFMNECQMDGMKHYQCVSLWNGGGIAALHSRFDIPLDVN
tara:strand:+ start:49 stop:258 length:210 start_codon:yes stop_codon:yes gene_type:complete